MTQEKISALVDGELADDSVDAVLVDLYRADAGATWDMYHQIGDALRSDELAFTMRPDFSARLARRLEAEPPLIASKIDKDNGDEAPSLPKIKATRKEWRVAKFSFKRTTLSGMAVATALAIAGLMSTPHLMLAANKAEWSNWDGFSHGVQKKMLAFFNHVTSDMPLFATSSAPSLLTEKVLTGEGNTTRDTRMDGYLLAHQHFSPSVYSAAQYARSATFTAGLEE